MKNQLLLAVCCVAALITLNACSSTDAGDTTADTSGLTSYDPAYGYSYGPELPPVDERVDTSDGSLVVGNPRTTTGDGWTGPVALADQHTIYFNYDSEQIKDQYVNVMQANAKYLRDNPNARVVIEGHTDERGTPEYNIALGERRARSVARYMQNLGVDVNQLSVVSYGEEKPVDPAHTESAWSRNRRAVLNY